MNRNVLFLNPYSPFRQWPVLQTSVTLFIYSSTLKWYSSTWQFGVSHIDLQLSSCRQPVDTTDHLDRILITGW